MSTVKIALRSAASTATETELALAARLSLPVIAGEKVDASSFDFYFSYEPAGLTLTSTEEKAPGGMRADFDDAQLQRRVSDKLREQNLSKAIGLKTKPNSHVLDGMAGLGKDAWLLASAGARVQMVERSPIVCALLGDALSRGQGDSAQSPVHRLQLQEGDLLELIAGMGQFDVVYLDPMFPSRQKQARAKKDMYVLQSILGEPDDNEAQLLELARQHASRRVVVKRAKSSPYLAGQRPDIEFKGSSNRYDVYLTASK